MSRLAESEREKCFAFTTSLNMSVLRDIASSALGSECCGIDKIYQGMMEQAQMSNIPADFYHSGGFNQVRLGCTSF